MAEQEKTPARVGKVVQQATVIFADKLLTQAQYPKAVEWLQKQIKMYES